MNRHPYYSAPPVLAAYFRQPMSPLATHHGLGYYAGGEIVPARIVYNGFGEPVGALAIPGLVKLLPRLISEVAPMAKAVTSMIPQAAGVTSQLLPMVENV